MQALAVPSSALIFGEKGLRVAVVDEAGRVTLRSVVIARDLGQTVEIAKGVSRSDRIVESPPDGLADGDMVHVVTAPSTTPATKR